MIEADFALFNVDQLVTLAPDAHPQAEGELGIIKRAALAARGSKIVWVGTLDEMHDQVRLASDATVVNTHGRCVLPGFVDPHTHPVFAGDRAPDFYRRALGAEQYADQAEGGIMRTVGETRAKSEDSLLDLAFQRADVFLQYGTTTVQAKTGYGLDLESEMKLLRVLNRLQHIQCLKLVPAFLPAHVVPPDFAGSADAFVDEIVDSWLSEARERAVFVDVWCDAGVFTAPQARRILAAARDLGYELTVHANELGPSEGVRLAVEMGARSVDHLNYLDDSDVQALASSETVAVLLPATTLFIDSDTYAPARQLLDAGATVALGTDFNPGTSYTQNMQLVLTLAVLKLGMTPEEAVRGATLNAARAINMHDRIGSLEPGKFCDFTVFCVGDYREIPYHMGMNLAETVVAGGDVVVREGQTTQVPHAFDRPS